MAAASPYAAQLAEVPVTERTMAVLGSTTHYWEYGPETGTPVVVVHGYRGDHHGFEPVIAQLPEVRFISPDLPGFGASTDMDREHSIPNYSAWLDAFLRELGLRGRAVLLGHSFGSIVTTYAIAHGLPTPKLILVNPIASDPMRGLVPRMTQLWYRVGTALPEGAGRAWLSNPMMVRVMSLTLAKTRDKALRRWIHEEHDRYFSAFATPRSLAQSFDASVSFDASKAVDALTMPTLLIAGDQDMIAKPEHEYALVGRLPDAQLVMLQGVGHLIHYERPVQAAAAIREFLAA